MIILCVKVQRHANSSSRYDCISIGTSLGKSISEYVYKFGHKPWLIIPWKELLKNVMVVGAADIMDDKSADKTLARNNG